MRAALLVLAACVSSAAAGGRYLFYRHIRDAGAAGSPRRLFGARAAPADAWGAACALLDRFWATRCSGTVLAPRWALTAAHCVSPRLAFVKYNSHHPASKEGDAAPVHYLYRHPGYRVVQEDEGRGMDVTLLHHDVGLVRTRDDMHLTSPPPHSLIHGMTLYDQQFLDGKTVDVLGFGRSERAAEGERLAAARLAVRGCARARWFPVVCGRGAGGAGVCAGDSGGPVLYRGVQVALTSLGPAECAAAPGPASDAASVFTALHRYAPLINSTIHETNEALRMQRVYTAPPPPRSSSARPACLYALGLLLATGFQTLLR